MHPDELFRAAEARAQTQAPPEARPDAALERLRAEAYAFFPRLPEPPVYRRAEDPARARARALLPEAEALLVRALLLARVAGPEAGPVLDALRAHVGALCDTADGRLEAAERAWLGARALERAAHRTRALLEPGAARPVWDPKARTSRFDPRTPPLLSATLACPNMGCKRVGEYAFHASGPAHAFRCAACQTPFTAWFGELRALQVADRRASRRYAFDLDALGGAGRSRVEFEEAAGEPFHAAVGDLLAFLYDARQTLRAVVDVTTGRLMWASPAGGCFLATAAYGPGASELDAFRALRDRVLLRRPWGRLLVGAYYRVGPLAARPVVRYPWAQAAVRRALAPLHRTLSRRFSP